MTPYLVRMELRRRWRTVLLLAALVALVGGTVLACLAGARRSDTAYDRYEAAIGPMDVMAMGPTDALDELEAVPFVDESIRFDSPALFPADGYFPMAALYDRRIPEERFRYPVIEGRRPDPTAPYEVALSERTAAQAGIAVGDRLAMESMGPAALALLNSEEELYRPDGPRLDLEVVGIVRDPGDLSARESDLAITFLTPAFREEHPLEEIASQGEGLVAELAAGHDITDLTAAMRGAELELTGTVGGAEARQQAEPTMRAEATALRVFAVVGAIAGLALLAYLIARAQQDAAGDDAALAALGVSKAQRTVRLAAPGWTAIAIGAPLGAVVAVAASRWFPIGLARRAEPDLGFDADLGILLPGIAMIIVVTIVLATAFARLGQRSPAAVVKPGLARSAARAGAPHQVVTALSLAQHRAGGRSSGAMAVLGTALGVLGVLAAAVFAASTDRLVESPRLYGWGWDANIAGADVADLDEAAINQDDVLADERFEAVGEAWFQVEGTTDDVPTKAIVMESLRGELAPVMVRGRAPREGEIALGESTLVATGRSVGDMVRVDLGGDEPQPLRVSGVVALPVSDDGGSSSSGAYLTRETARQLGVTIENCTNESCYRNLAVRLAPGVDLSTIQEHYTQGDPEAEGVSAVAVDVPAPPGEVERLTAVQDLPRYLAIMLAVLAAVAIAHAAATTVRGNRRTLGVLRALGMTRRQLGSVLAVQILVLTAVGAAIGALVGLAVGRQLWRLVVDQLPLPFSPALPLGIVVAALLTTIILGQLAAVASASRARRLPAHVALRAE